MPQKSRPRRRGLSPGGSYEKADFVDASIERSGDETKAPGGSTRPVFPEPDNRDLISVSEARGNKALVPGPGHSRHDRSLSVRVNPDAPVGFVVHSFCGDEPS